MRKLTLNQNKISRFSDLHTCSYPSLKNGVSTSLNTVEYTNSCHPVDDVQPFTMMAHLQHIMRYIDFIFPLLCSFKLHVTQGLPGIVCLQHFWRVPHLAIAMRHNGQGHCRLDALGKYCNQMSVESLCSFLPQRNQRSA